MASSGQLRAKPRIVCWPVEAFLPLSRFQRALSFTKRWWSASDQVKGYHLYTMTESLAEEQLGASRPERRSIGMGSKIAEVKTARRICVVSGTRAEYGLLKSVMEAIQAAQLELRLVI